MFTRIVVGIDGSQGGRDALVLARALAAPNADIALVYAIVYERQGTLAAMGGLVELMLQDGQAIVDELAEADPRFRTRVLRDWSAGHALHGEAEAMHADLVVIGSAHHGPVGRVLLGDVSRATLHGAPCPVAIAPLGFADHAEAAVASIGVGVDSSAESRAALALAVDLARDHEAALSLVTAVPTPATVGPLYAFASDWSGIQEQRRAVAQGDLDALARGIDGLTVETEAVDGPPGSTLEALSTRVDVLVAGSRGWGAFRRVVLGSTTDYLVHHAHCPVLVVPAPSRQENGAGDTREAAHA